MSDGCFPPADGPGWRYTHRGRADFADVFCVFIRDTGSGQMGTQPYFSFFSPQKIQADGRPVSHGEVPSACTMLTAASQVNQSCTHEPY